MQDQLTPKQVARAMNVSESSVKRWCDRGILASVRTAGGHRRIPMSGVLEFLRTSNQTLVRPEVVGLPATTGRGEAVVDGAAERLCEALLAGDEERARTIIFDLRLAGHRLSVLGDDVISKCFSQIGWQWERGETDVFQERRGCEIALRILNELYRTLPPVPAGNPTALGAAVEGDQFQLPTTLVELVLNECGWKATSLGSNIPFGSLGAAIESHRPKLFWLSASHIADVARFLRDYAEFFDQFGDQTTIIVGGQALTAPRRGLMRFAAHCDNLKHLESLASTLSKQHLSINFERNIA